MDVVQFAQGLLTGTTVASVAIALLLLLGSGFSVNVSVGYGYDLTGKLRKLFKGPKA